jgi:exodeoxyribonuclease VII small subunit
MSEGTTVTEITFEDGYDELKRIVERLDADDVTVHEMCSLFARGKGLEKALRSYLTDQQGKLDEIEAGEHLPDFAIIAPSESSGDAGAAAHIDFGDFASSLSPAPAPRVAAPADDEIPF